MKKGKYKYFLFRRRLLLLAAVLLMIVFTGRIIIALIDAHTSGLTAILLAILWGWGLTEGLGYMLFKWWK